MRVHQRAVDEIDLLSASASSRSSMSRNDMWQPEQPSSQTVAIFALLLIRVSSRIMVRYGRNWRCLTISATDRALLEQRAGRADVHALAAAGAALAGAPGLVQVGDHAASMPRPMTSQVCAPSISSQTRTQRVQRMQRLWSSGKQVVRGVDAALRDSGRAARRGSCPGSAPCACSSQWPLETQTEQMWLRSAKSSSSDHAAVLLQPLGLASSPPCPRRRVVTQAGSSLGDALDLDQAQAAGAEAA